MHTNSDLIMSALNLIKKGGSYQDADCKTFVELSLRGIGIKAAYRGSNEMIRSVIQDIQEMDDKICAGDIVFWVKSDGNEPERYKKGGEAYDEKFMNWNASHVGIYLGNEYIAESARSIGHWSITKLKKRKPNYYGRHPEIQYTTNGNEFIDTIKELINNDSKQTENKSVENTINTLTYAVVNTTKGRLNLRKQALDNATLLGRIERGQIVKIIDENNDWCRVISLDGKFLGYAMSKFLYKDNGKLSEAIRETKLNDMA